MPRRAGRSFRIRGRMRQPTSLARGWTGFLSRRLIPELQPGRTVWVPQPSGRPGNLARDERSSRGSAAPDAPLQLREGQLQHDGPAMWAARLEVDPVEAVQ